jgi:hypothetical protein
VAEKMRISSKISAGEALFCKSGRKAFIFRKIYLNEEYVPQGERFHILSSQNWQREAMFH